jgi:hypothetical protein
MTGLYVIDSEGIGAVFAKAATVFANVVCAISNGSF